MVRRRYSSASPVAYTIRHTVRNGGRTVASLRFALRTPNAATCLLSALEYHDLTTQLPFEVWIALPTRSRKPKLDGVRLQFFDARSCEIGLETVNIDGVAVRVYSPARTVADCFKYRYKIGLDVALEALRQGLVEKTNSGEGRACVACSASSRRTSRRRTPRER